MYFVVDVGSGDLLCFGFVFTPELYAKYTGLWEKGTWKIL